MRLAELSNSEKPGVFAIPLNVEISVDQQTTIDDWCEESQQNQIFSEATILQTYATRWWKQYNNKTIYIKS